MSKDPDDVDARAVYNIRAHFEGVSRLRSITGDLGRVWEGVIGLVGGAHEGPGAAWVGNRSKLVGGRDPITEMMALTGLGCRSRKDPFIDVAKLDFIALSGMTPGLNWKTPVAAKAAFTESGVNA